MPLTYTEIEEQKNMRIWIFFTVVLLFYFIIAIILGNISKAFFVTQSNIVRAASPFLTAKELLYVTLFAFVAAFFHSVYSIGNAMRFINQNLGTQSIDLSDKYHNRFNTILDEVNVAVGSKYEITPMVIPTVAMNAFAISGRNRNAVIGVTEGLLSRLNRQQLQAVVAHEVGHVVSGDSFQDTIACALFGVYAAMLSGIKKIFQGRERIRVSGRGGGGVILFLLIIYAVLNIMQFFYNLIRLFVSRDRELRADAVAVKLTRDPISLSEALYAISLGWRGFGFIDRNLESLFIINPAREDIDEREGFWADLLSTHPPIKKRMAILADMAHTDVKNIQESVLAQEKLREGLREIPVEGRQLRWMLMKNSGAWEGPFTISQMMLIGWVKPETWLKDLDSESVIKQAKDEPILKPFFDETIKGLKHSSFDCPKCKQVLVEEEYEGTTAGRCLFCNGVLVENDRLPRIIIRKEKGFEERIEKVAELAQKNGLDNIRNKVKEREKTFLKCPKCASSMIRNYFTMVYLVEVDRCNFCNLVWFDKDELEMVQYLVEKKKSGYV